MFACLLLIFLSAPLLLGKIGAWGAAVQFRIVFPSYPPMLALYISYIRRYAAQLVERLAESAINRFNLGLIFPTMVKRGRPGRSNKSSIC